MQLVKETFAPIKKIIGQTALADTASSIVVNGDPITILCMSGTMWVNPFDTASDSVNSFKMTEGMAIDLVVPRSLSIISDSSGANYQVIYWKL